MREVGRLYSPVLNLPRGVVEPFEFQGHDVPAGTTVRLALAGGHRLPTVFEQPESFDPDRFATPREEDKRTPYGLNLVWRRSAHLHRHQRRADRDQNIDRLCATSLPVHPRAGTTPDPCRILGGKDSVWHPHADTATFSDGAPW